MAHQPDGNTVAYWPLNEATTTELPGYADAADETGNYDATNATGNYDAPYIQAGPGPGMLARWGTWDKGRHLIAAADETIRQIFLGDFTFETLIYVDQLNGISTVFSYYAYGETLATNALFQLSVLSDSTVQVLWENGNGDDEEVISTSIITLRTWTHVAAVCTESGGTRSVTIYFDAVSAGSGSGDNAEGGTDANLYILFDIGTTRNLIGGVADMRISDVARTTTEMLAVVNSDSKQHPDDEDTVALWRFAERPECTAAVGGYHLAPCMIDSGGIIPKSPYAISPIAPGSIQAKGQGAATVNSYLVPRHEELLNLFLSSAWTFNGWFQQVAGKTAADHYLMWQWSNTGGPEQQEDNILLTVTIMQPSTDGRLRLVWEYGSGTNYIWYSTNPILTQGVDADLSAHMITVTRSGTVVYVYKDGVSFEDTGDFSGQEPDGGDALNQALHLVGANTQEPIFNADDISLSDVSRSAVEILAEYRGVTEGQPFAGSLPGV